MAFDHFHKVLRLWKWCDSFVVKDEQRSSLSHNSDELCVANLLALETLMSAITDNELELPTESMKRSVSLLQSRFSGKPRVNFANVRIVC